MAAKFISILGKLNHAIDLSMKASVLYFAPVKSNCDTRAVPLL